MCKQVHHLTACSRVEKEKAQLRSEYDDLAGQLETMSRGKVIRSVYELNEYYYILTE